MPAVIVDNIAKLYRTKKAIVQALQGISIFCGAG